MRNFTDGIDSDQFCGSCSRGKASYGLHLRSYASTTAIVSVDVTRGITRIAVAMVAGWQSKFGRNQLEIRMDNDVEDTDEIDDLGDT